MVLGYPEIVRTAQFLSSFPPLYRHSRKRSLSLRLWKNPMTGGDSKGRWVPPRLLRRIHRFSCVLSLCIRILVITVAGGTPPASKLALQLLQEVPGLKGRSRRRDWFSSRRCRRILVADSIATQLIMQGPWTDSENASGFFAVRCDLVERLSNNHFLDLIAAARQWGFPSCAERSLSDDTRPADPLRQLSHR